MAMVHKRLFHGTDVDARYVAVIKPKWGALASFLLAVTYIVPLWIYLVGNLRHALGPFAYRLAVFLYGPVWGVSLVVVVLML